jgi:redox-sensitive bicupin YhaK (pirin superfamily)
MTRVTQARGVERLVLGQDTQDGAGVRLTRVLSHDLQERLDPFLITPETTSLAFPTIPTADLRL